MSRSVSGMDICSASGFPIRGTGLHVQRPVRSRYVNEAGNPGPLPLEERRERAIRVLGEHFAEDHLSVEEFERQVDRVYSATTAMEIEGVFQELPALRSAVSLEHVEPALPVRARAEDVPARGMQFAVLSGTERKGAWTPARRFTSIALMGGAGLDLREARLGPGVTEILVISIMGGTEIIVPPGLAVQTRGFGLLGGFEGVDQPSADPDPDAPILIIKGFALMGGVEVAVREPGETARDARRRRKDERRARRHQHTDRN